MKALKHRGPSLAHHLVPPSSPVLPLSPLIPLMYLPIPGNPGANLTCVSRTRIPAGVSHTPSLLPSQTDLQSPSIKGKLIFANISKFFLILLFLCLSRTSGVAYAFHLPPPERCSVWGRDLDWKGEGLGGALGALPPTHDKRATWAPLRKAPCCRAVLSHGLYFAEPHSSPARYGLQVSE